MGLSRKCIINVCFKGDSEFHKVDDLTVPDDAVRSEFCGGNVLREGALHSG